MGLFFAQHLLLGAHGVQLRAPSLGAALHLCAGQRFAEERSAAYCSGVLVDADLVLTAGHCLGPSRAKAGERCPSIRIGFNYKLQQPTETEVSLASSDVYTCRQVVAYAAPDADSSDDYAILQLDRTVGEEQAPVRLSERSVMVGDTAVLATHGAGLPLKVELAARVAQVSDDGSFLLASDTFSGASGGGMYDDDLALTGFHVSGGADYEWRGDCAVVHSVEQATERFAPARPALHQLCESGWPSARLCGIEPVCGDGTCSGEERTTCPADCSPTRCGDRSCELDERGLCVTDCDPFPDVPETWTGDPASYVPFMGESRAAAQPRGGCQFALYSSKCDCFWLAVPGVCALIAGRRVRLRAKAASRRVPQR